jgi:hypothetical protein
VTLVFCFFHSCFCGVSIGLRLFCMICDACRLLIDFWDPIEFLIIGY